MRWKMAQRTRAVLSSAGAAWLVSCSSAGAGTESAPVSSAEAITEASDSAHPLELGGLLGALEAPLDSARRAESTGFRCDASPELTPVTVCGKALPATAHFEWTDCAGGGEHGGPRGPGGEPPLPPDGGGPPPGSPPGDQHGRGRGPPPDGAREGARPPEGAGASSGAVDVTRTYALSPADDCAAGTLTTEQTSTFSVTRDAREGGKATVAGTFQATSTGPVGARSVSRMTRIDTTRTLTDDAGATVKSAHLTGTLTIAFDETAEPKTHTLDGSLEETLSTGEKSTVTAAQVVRPSPRVCHWPLSGTLTRLKADGTQDVLVFGPTCGAATLNGAAIELPARGGPPDGRPPHRR